MNHVNQVIFDRQADTYFLQFAKDAEGKFDEACRQSHLQWLTDHGATFEAVAAAPGAEDGVDDGIYVVDINPATVQEYANQFENSDGISNERDKYQMFLVIFKDWLHFHQQQAQQNTESK